MGLLLSISLIVTDIEESITPEQTSTYFSMSVKSHYLMRNPLPGML